MSLPPEDAFDGGTYDPDRDFKRLTLQSQKVWSVMIDGEWHMPRELEIKTGYMWASISARLRDFRKQKYGGHVVQRKNLGGGTNAYRLIKIDSQQEA